jgi:hypothetical protein
MIVGLDLGHADVQAAEHWLHANAAVLGGPGVVVCTHLVRGERPRVALSVEGVDPSVLPTSESIDPAVASEVAGEHEARRSGRAVLYPGVDALVGTVSVGHVLTRSVIERVTVLGGPPPGIDVLIDTRDFVRPQWTNGQLTLIATPGSAGHIAPFEFPNPKACGGGH